MFWHKILNRFDNAFGRVYIEQILQQDNAKFEYG